MSLLKTKKFLQVLDQHFPIPAPTGEDSRCHHAIMLEQDKILLMLHTGPNWQTFLLDEKDLDKDPEEIVSELKQLLIKE